MPRLQLHVLGPDLIEPLQPLSLAQHLHDRAGSQRQAVSYTPQLVREELVKTTSRTSTLKVRLLLPKPRGTIKRHSLLEKKITAVADAFSRSTVTNSARNAGPLQSGPQVVGLADIGAGQASTRWTYVRASTLPFLALRLFVALRHWSFPAFSLEQRRSFELDRVTP